MSTPIPSSSPSAPASRPSFIARASKALLNFAIEQWFLIGIVILIILAYFFPNVGRRGGSVRSEYTVNYLAVAIIFFISGLSLPYAKLVKHSKNIRLHLIVQIYAFLFTSAVFYGIAVAASTNPNIETSVLVGLIATGCLPTTISSNVTMTGQAGGDVAATMVSVVVSNLIGPFITPLLIAKLYLPSVAAFADWVPDEAVNNLNPLYASVMMQIGLSVYVPLFVGQVIRAIWTDLVQKTVTKFQLGKLGQFCLLLILWSTFCNAFYSGSLETLNTASIVFNIFINLILCIAFTLFAFITARPPRRLERVNGVLFKRVNKEECIAMCFCCPAKTQALGIPLLASMYPSASDMTRALVQIPVILYTVEQIFVGQFMVWWFKRWLARDKAKRAREKEEAESGLSGVSMSGEGQGQGREAVGQVGGEIGDGADRLKGESGVAGGEGVGKEYEAGRVQTRESEKTGDVGEGEYDRVDKRL